MRIKKIHTARLNLEEDVTSHFMPSLTGEKLEINLRLQNNRFVLIGIAVLQSFRFLRRLLFGRVLMSKLKTVYENCPDIKYFAGWMYSLWESLPGNIHFIIRKEPPHGTCASPFVSA